jgi:uncharacterized protein YbaR (Trm112 family)
MTQSEGRAGGIPRSDEPTEQGDEARPEAVAGGGAMSEAGEQEQKLIPDDLLAILACPACRAEVKLVGDRLVCQGCGRKYRIEDGIPIMLIDQAEM